jgi:hypothetical protein
MLQMIEENVYCPALLLPGTCRLSRNRETANS